MQPITLVNSLYHISFCSFQRLSQSYTISLFPYRTRTQKIISQAHLSFVPFSDQEVEALDQEDGYSMTRSETLGTTQAYPLSTFARPWIQILDEFSSVGEDTNGNGLADLLRITVNVDVIAAGPYRLAARLLDGSGREVCDRYWHNPCLFFLPRQLEIHGTRRAVQEALWRSQLGIPPGQTTFGTAVPDFARIDK